MNPYSALGVSKDASQEDIKAAFRKRARTMHPDMKPDDPRAAEDFKNLNTAYDILSDPEKRARFDRGEIDEQGNEKPTHFGGGAGRWRRAGGAGGTGGPGGAEAGFDFSDLFSGQEDIFSEIFGGARSRPGARSRGPRRSKGSNISYTLKVPFEEAARGGSKRLSLTNGKSVDVKIPPGTTDRTTLRLKNQGLQGIGGGETGDALVEIRVEPHPYFRQEGQDIHVDAPVSLKEAVQGGKITVPTLHGKVAVNVPENANTGSVLRLRGKGIERKGKRGDQLVHLQVHLPPEADKALKKFVASWKPKTSGESLRKKTFG